MPAALLSGVNHLLSPHRSEPRIKALTLVHTLPIRQHGRQLGIGITEGSEQWLFCGRGFGGLAKGTPSPVQLHEEVVELDFSALKTKLI